MRDAWLQYEHWRIKVSESRYPRYVVLFVLLTDGRFRLRQSGAAGSISQDKFHYAACNSESRARPRRTRPSSRCPFRPCLSFSVDTWAARTERFGPRGSSLTGNVISSVLNIRILWFCTRSSIIDRKFCSCKAKSLEACVFNENFVLTILVLRFRLRDCSMPPSFFVSLIVLTNIFEHSKSIWFLVWAFSLA